MTAHEITGMATDAELSNAVSQFPDTVPDDVASDIAGQLHEDPYDARPIKRRRATQAEMAARFDAIEALAAEHYPCSVRHLFYRATVAKVPTIGKDIRGYTKVQRAVLQLRREGRIPYSWITDNSRTAFMVDVWGGLDGFLDDMAGVYRRDLWDRSPFRVEVWCESDSIAGTLMDIAHRWRVGLFPIKGQSSETFAYNAAQNWLADPAREVVVLYVGDHDPAGVEIEQALRVKLEGFAAGMDHSPLFSRVGVTWEQVQAYDLPGTNPKKAYGYPLAVEAEALPPRVLREMVNDTIAAFVDEGQLQTLLAVEEEERRGLRQLVDTFHGGTA